MPEAASEPVDSSLVPPRGTSLPQSREYCLFFTPLLLLGAIATYWPWFAWDGLSFNVIRRDERVAGRWGGTCTCPDGRAYEVGHLFDGCRSLACVGGTAGECRAERKFDHQVVECEPAGGCSTAQHEFQCIGACRWDPPADMVHTQDRGACPCETVVLSSDTLLRRGDSWLLGAYQAVPSMTSP